MLLNTYMRCPRYDLLVFIEAPGSWLLPPLPQKGENTMLNLSTH